ncbi:DUF1217 domain-containing protein [Hyphococcus formosus]|uniref:DUF1217 domain-containing protein n=1 Tax=Hyphococcus formosus TaxID=3143534 RepID=UPI00398BA4DA
MTFTPAIPLGGYLGWRVFENSADRQFEAFKNTPEVTRNIEYFTENVKNALTAEDLVKDRKLLTVALGAYGLQDEIDKAAFVRKVLEEGTDDPSSFANRLNDTKWKAFAKDFGYGNLGGTRVLISSFREQVATDYMQQAFEARVGDVNTDMRLAMNFRREIATIAENPNVDRVGWYSIMGDTPLRTVLEGAFGLPASIGTADIDQQKELFEQKASQLFGGKSPAVFKDPAVVEDALRRFFVFSELENGPTASTPGSAALTLLSGQSASSQAQNLFLSLVS